MTPTAHKVRFAASPLVVAVALGLLSPSLLLDERAERKAPAGERSEGGPAAPRAEAPRG